MDIPALQKRIEEIIVPLVEEECCVLVELRLVRSSKGLRLAVFADRQEGGITLATCALLNKRISESLEGHEVFTGPYMLEVSSPGVDRNLHTEADFKRSLHKRVKFFLAEPVEGKLEWDGEVTAVDGQSVTIQAKDKIFSIDLGKINKARQIV